MRRSTRTIAAAGFSLALALGGVACSDEDGDGATTDEEVGELEEGTEDVRDQIGEEIDAGEEEVENNE